MNKPGKVSRLPRQPDLSDYTDVDLLEYAAMRNPELGEEEAALVEEAFAELYRRHSEPVYQILRRSPQGRAYSRCFGTNALEALVDDTFLRACERANTYDHTKTQVPTWIVRIANNLINDGLRTESRRTDERSRVAFENEDIEQVASLVFPIHDNETATELDQVMIIRDAMEAAITHREWELMTIYLAIQCDGSTPGRADRGALKHAATDLGTTPGNLRSTTSRAIGKMKDYVLEHYPDKVPD